MVSMLSYLKPSHEVDERVKQRLKHHFVPQNDKEAWGMMRDLIHGLGLGSGLIEAEDAARGRSATLHPVLQRGH